MLDAERLPFPNNTQSRWNILDKQVASLRIRTITEPAFVLPASVPPTLWTAVPLLANSLLSSGLQLRLFLQAQASHRRVTPDRLQGLTLDSGPC